MRTSRIILDCPVSPWWVAAGGAVLLAIIVAVVWRDVSRVGRGRARLMLFLSALGVLLVTAVALAPKWIRTWQDPHRPQCLLLIDGSRSMLFADRYRGEAAAATAGQPGTHEAGPSRQEVVRLLLENAPGRWLDRLGRQFELRAWRFAGDLSALPLRRGPAAFEVDPEGYATALGEAMDRVVHGAGERPRAVILISDGAWNTGRDPTEVARMLGRLGTPVFVIGVGVPDPPRDVAVLALRGPRRVLLGDELILTAEVATSGIGAVRIPVELVSNGEVIDTKEIIASSSGQSSEGRTPITVNFSMVPGAPGRQHCTVRVAAQAGEQDTSNNKAHFSVDVDERKIRVLMIDSEPRWQFRFLRNAMERDPAAELKICLLRPGLGPIVGEGYLAEPPADKKSLAEFDLIILGDVPPAKLPERFLAGVADMLRVRSGALMVMAGRKGCYRQLAHTPLGRMLPVTLGGTFAIASRGGAPFRAELTERGRTHLVTRLTGKPDENEAAWRRLPKLRWCAAVSGLAPGADSLLVHPHRLAGPDKLPLLAVHQVGAGKVMFCGVDETWRWRREIGDKYFYRFWAQSIRWLVKKPFTEGDRRARLSLARNVTSVGEKVEIEAYCLGPDGFPLQDAAGRGVWLRIDPPALPKPASAGEGPEDGPSEQVAMQPAPGGWGIYRAHFTPRQPGKFVVRPVVSLYGNEPLKSSATLLVLRADLEKNFLAQDRAALTAIAEASGGEFFQTHQVDQLAERLAAKSVPRRLTAEFSPTRHWAYYLTVVGVLSLLWLTRKRTGLA